MYYTSPPTSYEEESRHNVVDAIKEYKRTNMRDDIGVVGISRWNRYIYRITYLYFSYKISFH